MSLIPDPLDFDTILPGGRQYIKSIQTGLIFNNETAAGLSLYSMANFLDVYAGDYLGITTVNHQVSNIGTFKESNIGTSYLLNVGQEVNIIAAQYGEINTGTSLCLDVGTSFCLEAQVAHLTLSSDMFTDVSGSMTNSVSGDLTNNVIGNLASSVTGNLTNSVIGNLISTVTGSINTTVTGSFGVTASDAITFLSTSGISLTTTGSVVLTGYEFIVDTIQPFGLTSSDVNLAATGSASITAGTTMLLQAQDYMTIVAGNGLNVFVTGAPIEFTASDGFDIDSDTFVEISAGTTTLIESGQKMTITNAAGGIDILGSAGMTALITGDLLLHGTASNTLGVSTAPLNLYGDNVTIGTGITGGLITLTDDTTIYGNLSVIGQVVDLQVQQVLTDSNTIVLDDVPTPTDALAANGGVILRGTTDKTILYNNSVPTVGASGFGAWTLNQNVNLANDTSFCIQNKVVLNNNNLAVNIGVTGGHMYLNGAQSRIAPTLGDFRWSQDHAHNKFRLVLEQYNGSIWAQAAAWDGVV